MPIWHQALTSNTPSWCSFESVHPVLADAHYLRTRDEDERLRRARMEVERRLQMACQSPIRSEHSRRRLHGVVAGALPAPQLPDWDRVASPKKDSSSSAKPQWRPVSPSGRTEALTAATPKFSSRVLTKQVHLQAQATVQANVRLMFHLTSCKESKSESTMRGPTQCRLLLGPPLRH